MSILEKARQQSGGKNYSSIISKARSSYGVESSNTYERIREKMLEDERKSRIQQITKQAEQAKIAEQEAYNAPILRAGRFVGGLTSGLLGKAKEFGGRVAKTAGTILKGATPGYKPTPEESRQAMEASKGVVTGAAKNIGELASGTARMLYKAPDVINRVLPEVLTPKKPEYLQKFGESKILNYKPEYKNEYEKTGGDIAEVGSWLIPLTRLGKIEKAEEAITKIPKVAEFLGATPKIIKSGGKLFYEVAKDAVDAGLLASIRGKGWDEIEEEAKMAGVGGLALRGAGKLVAKILKPGEFAPIAKEIQETTGKKLTAKETLEVKDKIEQGFTKEEIVDDIVAPKRTELALEPVKVKEEVKSPAEPKTKPIPEAEKLAGKKVGKNEEANLEIFKKAPEKTEEATRLYQTSAMTDNLKPGEYLDTNLGKQIDRGTPSEGKYVVDIPNNKVNEYLEPARVEGEFKIKKQIPEEYIKFKKEIGETPKPKKEGVKEKVSKIAKSIEQKMKDSGMLDDGGTIEKATFAGKTVKGQAEKSAKIITDTEKMNKILSGEEAVPSDLSPVFLGKAIEDHAIATNNYDLIAQLAKSDLVERSSLSAQDLRFAQERNPDSITAKFQEIRKAKQEALKKKLQSKDVEKAKTTAKKQIKKKLSEVKIIEKDWASFINEIKCK